MINMFVWRFRWQCLDIFRQIFSLSQGYNLLLMRHFFSYLAVLAILSDIVAVPVLTILSKVQMGAAIHIYSVSMKSYQVVNQTLFCIEKHQNIHFGNIIVVDTLQF